MSAPKWASTKPRSETHLFDQLPKDSAIGTLYESAINELMTCMKSEFQEINIDSIVTRFKPALNKFHAISIRYRQKSKLLSKNLYNEILRNLIDTLCTVYSINKKEVFVKLGTPVPYWGGVYWEFLHLASILLSYGYNHLKNEDGSRKIKDFQDFSCVVYNIDFILPCSECEAHYKAIKYKLYDLKEVSKMMSFGMVVLGAHWFHQIITRNIASLPRNLNRPIKRLYDLEDFALDYHCVALTNEVMMSSENYVDSIIDWQPKTHVLLSIILSRYCNQPFTRASNLLKRRLYESHPLFADFDLNINFDYFVPYTDNEVLFVNMTRNQVIYCIVEALLLQFHNTQLTEDDIKNDDLFKNAIVSFYKMYPNVMQMLFKTNKSFADKTANKFEQLLMIDTPQTMKSGIRT